jgi:hypothetical protein
MNYKQIILVFTFVLALDGCVGVSPDGRGYNITVPLSVINTTVAQNFPQSQKTNYGTLLIDKPNILGKQGSNKLGVGTSFSFSNMFIPNGVKGQVHFSGGIRYNPRDKGLYLTSPMIDELKFQNFSLSSYLTPQMRNAIGDIIAQQLIGRPIYRINNVGASLVKGIGVQNGNIILTLGL